MDHKVSFQTAEKKEANVFDGAMAKSFTVGGVLLMVFVLVVLAFKLTQPEKVVSVPPAELFKTPEHYIEGKVPASALEKRAYGDYLQGLKTVEEKKLFGEELRRAENDVALGIARKYRMPPKSVAYLVLKLGYREVPPDAYVPPTEPD